MLSNPELDWSANSCTFILVLRIKREHLFLFMHPSILQQQADAQIGAILSGQIQTGKPQSLHSVL